MALTPTGLELALQGAPGITPFPSEANFILFRTKAPERLYSGLKQRGILVKCLHGADAALEGCLRVTVGTPDENERFLDAVDSVLA